MEWSNKKNAYLKGYTELSYLDTKILESGSVVPNTGLVPNTIALNAYKMKSDWEKTGTKLPYDYADDLIPKGTMYTDIDNLFRYSKDIDTVFDDPTYLGYTLKIETESSALWNYGVVDIAEPGETGSALSFINKYATIPEIAQRRDIYFEFLTRFSQLFGTTLNYNKFVKSNYIESITGLDKLMEKMVKYNAEDKLTVMLTEDVSLKSTYISELYNNLIYSYNNQRYVMPENTLRFDLLIEISDIRVFRNVVADGSGSTIFSTNSTPPKMVFRLHDCNFDFFKSRPFPDGITMGGGDQADKSARNISFDIKYKSITREFSSPLINSMSLFNKGAKIVNNTLLANEKYFAHNIFSDEKKQIKDDQIDFSTSEQLTTQNSLTQNSTIQNNPLEGAQNANNQRIQDFKLDWEKGLGASLTSIAIDNINDYTQRIIGKFNEIRGVLFNELIRQLREPFNMPRIYPDNVYDPDFRTLSLQNFVNGLGSDILNELTDTAQNTVNTFFNNLTGGGSPLIPPP